ncbi:hypothetical protein [Hyphobacterium sp.]|uniref:hypothetical protein n=1 Tax=Hyphobacterium sp. TaxID=2004662 RepID=UPI003749DF07
MRLLVLLFGALSLAACASPYVATPYEADLYPVRTIGLVEDVGDSQVIAYEVASMGSNFGIVGALVDAGVQSSRRARVEEILEGEGFDAQAYFRERIIMELEALGYNVETVSVGERDGVALFDSYEGFDHDVDAHLDVVLQQYGLLSSGTGKPFRPHAAVEGRMVNRADQAVIMENSIIYAPLGSPEGRILLSPPPDASFRNREEILEDPVSLVESIQMALDETAATFARLLAQ